MPIVACRPLVHRTGRQWSLPVAPSLTPAICPHSFADFSLHLADVSLSLRALTGKYTPDNPPTGPRGRIYTPEFLTKLQPLINRIKEIGEKYGKTSTEVVLNWLIAQENVVPIPGAKNAEQAQEFAGAIGWKLSNDEVDELRSLAKETQPVIGFPVNL